MSLLNRVALVTGGASGLGRAATERILKLGGSVVIADLPKSDGHAVAKSLGDKVRFHPTDVRNETEVAAALDLAEKEFGKPVSINVNSAGYGILTKTLDKDGKPHPLDSFQRLIDVNLIGTFNSARLSAERMAKLEPDAGGERGVIINLASIAGLDHPGNGQLAYATSKAAVVCLTLSMARDLASFGIRVNAAAPGVFETTILAAAPPEVKKALIADVLFPPRMGHVDEFAHLVQFFLENRMINGEIIRIDGVARVITTPGNN